MVWCSAELGVLATIDRNVMWVFFGLQEPRHITVLLLVFVTVACKH
jgi:hypothetical protein